MSKDKEIIIPIPEEHREKLTELLKAYQPQRKALKEIETLGAKYGKQSINDIQYTSDAYLKDVEKICASARTKKTTRPKTGFTAHSTKKYKSQQKKFARMKKLYRKFRDKDYSEQECYNIISERYYPEHSTSTVETYITKK